MIFGALGIALLALVSYGIDFYRIPWQQARTLWDVLFCAISIFLLVRMRMKMKEGTFERLQREYKELLAQYEAERDRSIQTQINELRTRIEAMEQTR
jgi:hypothetical protein